MDIQGLEKLYEGKAKVVYPSPNPDEVYMVFKDDATAFDGKKRGTIQGKGYYNAKISSILFRYLEANGVRTHFVSQVDDITLRVKKLKIFPVEVVVRNIVAGSLAKRSGKPEGFELAFPVLEFYYKSDELGDPMFNEDHILAFGLCTQDEIVFLKDCARKVNDILKPFFYDRGLLLVDFKLEFGRSYQAKDGGQLVLGDILLGDEISPDTCRFWDVSTREKLDKDRFRRDLGRVEEAYAEVLRRISR